MKIVVNEELCEANAVCVKQAPGVFEVGDDDRVRLLIARVGEEQLARVQNAVRRCPRQALSLVEE